MKRLLILVLISLALFSGCLSNNNAISIVDTSQTMPVEVTNNNTKPVITQDIQYDIAQGKVDRFDKVHKFGGGVMTTNFAPVTQSGFYRTPSTPVSLEILSDSAADTYGGAGAQQVTITGLNSSWDEITFTVNLNGTTPVTLPVNMLRVYRWYVSSSGTYATQSLGSHQGELEIREAGNGPIWSIIPVSPFPAGQSEIGAYTIPKGYAGYLLAKNIFTDTSKTADFYFFQRGNADDVTTPYNGTMRLIEREVGVQGGYRINFDIPKGPIIGPADIGYIGYVSVGSADVSVEFELVLTKSE